MTKKHRRTPRYYDGVESTAHQMRDILPSILRRIGDVYEVRPDLILASWPELIGPRLASMTRAATFVDGVLTVKVKNSTLHSLLSQHEKARILRILRSRFPKVDIKNVFFRIG